MLDIVLLIVFSVMAARIVISVLRNSAIYAEFGQSKGIAFLAPLFPLGPVILFLLARQSFVPAVAAASACYLPALVLARRQIHAFEHAGTDRVQNAMSASYQAFGVTLAGLIYISGVVVLALFTRYL